MNAVIEEHHDHKPTGLGRWLFSTNHKRHRLYVFMVQLDYVFLSVEQWRLLYVPSCSSQVCKL